jgi:hypothetical protein
MCWFPKRTLQYWADGRYVKSSHFLRDWSLGMYFVLGEEERGLWN